MTDERMVTIYVLKDPRFEEDVDAIRYVGQTVRDLRVRLRGHLSSVKTTKERNHRVTWLRQLLQAGIEPTITPVTMTTLSQSDDTEKVAIAHYRTMGCRLTNTTNGGGLTQAKLDSLKDAWHDTRLHEQKRIAMQKIWNDPAQREVRLHRIHDRQRTEEYRTKLASIVRETQNRPDIVARKREQMKRRWQSEEYHQMMCKRAREFWNDPNCRELAIAARKKAGWTPGGRVSHSAKMKALWADPEYRSRTATSISNACRTEDGHNKKVATTHALWANEEYRKKQDGSVQRAYANNPQLREKVSQSQRAAWQDPEIRAKRLAGRTPERQSAAARALWNDPVKRADLLATRKASYERRKACRQALSGTDK